LTYTSIHINFVGPIDVSSRPSSNNNETEAKTGTILTSKYLHTSRHHMTYALLLLTL
jgi:hypothetical protein